MTATAEVHLRALPNGTRFKVTAEDSAEAGIVFIKEKNVISEESTGEYRTFQNWEPITVLKPKAVTYTKAQKRQLINMRDCLMKAKAILAKSRKELHADKHEQHICHAICRTDNGSITKLHTKNLVMRGIAPHFVFSVWVREANPHESFRETQMQTLRHRWVDQLIRDITTAIGE